MPKKSVLVASLIMILLSGFIFARVFFLQNKLIASNKKIVSKAKPLVTPTSMSKPTATPAPTATPSATPTPTLLPSPTATPTPAPTIIIVALAELENLFTKYSSQYGIDKELLKRIANCESGLNSNARTTLYGGLFQFSESLWVETRTLMGQDSNVDLRFNAEEAIETAAFMLSQGHSGIWPNCNK